MIKFKMGTYKDIEQFIDNGYEPVGDLKFVLNNYKHLLFSRVTLCISYSQKFIDIQEIFVKKTISLSDKLYEEKDLN